MERKRTKWQEKGIEREKTGRSIKEMRHGEMGGEKERKGESKRSEMERNKEKGREKVETGMERQRWRDREKYTGLFLFLSFLAL